MEFHCEDLPSLGIVLIPPSSPEYDALLADIQWRIDNPVEGAPKIPLTMPWMQIDPAERETSAILVNRSQSPIALMQLVWRYESPDGSTSRGAMGGVTGPSLLLPFGLSALQLAFESYWRTILPGSKRYLARFKVIGDNSDVRPPQGDEIWKGGAGGGGGGRSRGPNNAVRTTLVLDGIFFADGSFAGPNNEKLWEQVTITAEGISPGGQDCSRAPQ